MDETLHNVELRLVAMEQEIKSLKHRMDSQEEQAKDLNSLARSVDKLATNMEVMLKEQNAQRKDIDALKLAPADDLKAYRRAIISSVITAFFGGLVGFFLARFKI